MAVATPVEADWLKGVLFRRGYLARMKGETIKVYLSVLAACGGEPGRDVTMSLSQLMDRTRLSSPTVIECLLRLERLGLVAATSPGPGRVKTYSISDPEAVADLETGS